MFIDVLRSTCHRPSCAPARLVGALALCAAGLLAPEAALAEPTGAAPSTLQQADAAFEQGRALLEAGQYKQACEQFELSQRLDPSPGTQLNLGNCREREGELVQALATFEQALDGAREAPDRRRRQLWSDAARERIASLTPRVPQVSVRGVPEGAELSIDGRPSELWAGWQRINPGPHELTLSAPGKRPFARRFELVQGQQLAIDVPPLAPLESAPRAEVQGPQEDPSRFGVWPYVLGGAGALLLGTSVVTGLGASAASDELDRECTNGVCDPSLEDTRDRANRLAALTDVFWISGVIAAGAGVTLFVLDLGHAEAPAALQAGCFGSGCGLRASGRF